MSNIRKNVNIWEEISQIEKNNNQQKPKNPSQVKADQPSEDSLSILDWQSQDIQTQD